MKKKILKKYIKKDEFEQNCNILDIQLDKKVSFNYIREMYNKKKRIGWR